MINDFSSRIGINYPSFFQLICGCLLRRKSHKRYLRLIKKGSESFNKDLNIVKILKEQKIQAI